MFWSKNDFFKHRAGENEIGRLKRLASKKRDVLTLFDIKEIHCEIIERFNDSYDFFVVNYNDFDGDTIVKDLDDLRDLSISGLIHDYGYLVALKNCKWYKYIFLKILLDWEYAQDLTLLGKSNTIAYSRATLLILTTPLYLMMKLIKKLIK